MKTEFTSSFKNWITTNIQAGQDPDVIFKVLLDEGYPFAAISAQMNYYPSRNLSEVENPFTRTAQQNSRRVQNGLELQQKQDFSKNHGQPISRSDIIVPNGISIESDKVDLRTVDNFLNAQDCERLISIIESNLRPSPTGNSNVNKYIRSSQTCDFGLLKDPFIASIDDRICNLIGIQKFYSEAIQGQYYQSGQEFKAHTDFIKMPSFNKQCRGYGQRTFTVMIYLNDVKRGGETSFKRIGTDFKPVRGKAVIWNNLNPDGTPNMDTLHEAKPVEGGYKAVLTKWFRSKHPNAQYTTMFI